NETSSEKVLCPPIVLVGLRRALDVGEHFRRRLSRVAVEVVPQRLIEDLRIDFLRWSRGFGLLALSCFARSRWRRRARRVHRRLNGWHTIDIAPGRSGKNTRGQRCRRDEDQCSHAKNLHSVAPKLIAAESWIVGT